MLTKGQKVQPEDRVLPEEKIKDPFVLEFLDLMDEYSETDQVKHGRCMDCRGRSIEKTWSG